MSFKYYSQAKGVNNENQKLLKNRLKVIFDDNYNALCNYASAFVNDHSTAEDIVQTVFIQLWENEKIYQLAEPQAFLKKCVKYKCIDYTRSKKSRKEIPSEVLPELMKTETHSLSEEDVQATLQLFASQLPPKMQKVFLMSRVQGMSYAEIAAEQNVSVKTVENQMGVALKKMRELLRKHGYIPLLVLALR